MVAVGNRTAQTSERQRRIAEVMRRLERGIAQAEANGEHRQARILNHAGIQLIDHNNPAFFATIARLKQTPVTIEEFVQSKEFLGDQVEMWPALMQDLYAMNPDILAGEPPVNEVLMGGATGIGKSFMAMITQANATYYLTCINQPQLLFGLAKSTPIVQMFQSVSEGVTKRVLYQPFRTMFTAMPYTKKWVRYNKYKEHTLDIDGGIQVIPALASLQSMVGQAIIGGILDEVNYMNIIEQSMMVVGNRGLGGRYDQAEIAYTNISRRRKRSFTTRGPVPGCIILSSSTRYENDFLDRRVQQAKTNGEVRTDKNLPLHSRA